MSEKVKNVLRLLEELAPKEYAMSWDNVGLQVGDREDTVSRILVCLDVTEAVIDEAVKSNADFIVSHHPVIFKPIKSLLKDNPQGRMIHKAIKHDISIYCGHTNIDIAPGGLNDYIARRLGLKDTGILDVTYSEKLYKLVVFIPEAHQERVAEALASEGAGHIGNYSSCSFRTTGIGAFMPLDGSNPYIGTKGKLEKVQEVRLETIVSEKKLKAAINKMIAVHPYEEVAYDIYPLALEGNSIGIGRVGNIEKSMSLSALIDSVKGELKLEKLKTVGELERVINRVCIVNGSGAEYIQAAVRNKCDCLITGDVKYHEAQMALELGLCIIDAGHFETENIFIELMANYLKDKINAEDLSIEVIESKINVNPFKVI